MAVLGGVAVLELKDGLSEGMAWGEGASATKNFLVPDWTNRYIVANALLGVTSYTIIGGKLVINAPGAYFDSPNLICRQVAIRGAGSIYQGARAMAFTSAVISASYGVPQWQPPGSDPGGLQSFDPTAPLVYATQSIKYSGQVLPLPKSKLKISGTNASLDGDFSRFVGINNLTITLHQYPFLPTVAMRALVGQMNSAAIFGAGKGNLILGGIDTNATAAVDGSFNQEVTFSLSERPEAPWDYTYTGNGSSGWEQVVTTSGAKVIPSGDFTALLPAFYRGL